MCFLRMINKDVVYWDVVCILDNLIDMCVDSYTKFTAMAITIKDAIMEDNNSITKQGFCKPEIDKLNQKLMDLDVVLKKARISGQEYTKFSNWLDWWKSSSSYVYYQQETRNCNSYGLYKNATYAIFRRYLLYCSWI